MLNEFGILAAQGDEISARILYDRIIAETGDGLLYPGIAAVMGDRDKANAIAASLDAPDAANACRCGAPFDLEFTPNFARMIEEADLAWPPPRPIEWPLKDW